MTLQELIFYCATTDNGKRDIEKCYEKGRAEAIEKITEILARLVTMEMLDLNIYETIKAELKEISND